MIAPVVWVSRNRSFMEQSSPVLVGYMRVSKATAPNYWTCNETRSSLPGSRRIASTRTTPPASATTGRGWRRA